MSFLSALYMMLIGPLELLFESIYMISYNMIRNIGLAIMPESFAINNNVIGSVGLAIIPVSIAINTICLPLYLRADQIQNESREKEAKIKPMRDHIRKNFKGDEKYMILQTYYRLEGYKPIHSLKSSFSLLLQIPFFMAAYHFLSHLELFKGVSFGPINDLSLPDGALTIGGVSINILPVLMTLVNIVSSSIYSKKTSLRDKVQLYGLALVFLVLLYRSPAGLVFYWLLNNIYSLCKNIIMEYDSKSGDTLQKDYQVVSPEFKKIFVAVGIGFAAVSALISMKCMLYRLSIKLFGNNHGDSYLPGLYVIAAVPVIILGVGVLKFRKEIFNKIRMPETTESNSLRFVAGCLFMAILTGFLIPSAVISSSPMEFVNLTDFHSPLMLLVYSSLTAGGTFLFWAGIFYYLAGSKTRLWAEVMIFVLAGLSVINYMMFSTDLGNMSPTLQYDITPDFSIDEKFMNLFICLVAALLLYLIWKKYTPFITSAVNLLNVVIVVMAIRNTGVIHNQIPQIKQAAERVSDTSPTLRLSRNGKNVVVLILDKAVDSFVPYIFYEKPELREKFRGFTWYPNTISYGNMTNVGAPGLYGGYEYIPEEMNRRSDEWLGDKQNEALRLMPVLFDEAGYDVTVCDPAYAGYQNIPDLSIFDDHPDIRAFITGKGMLRKQTSGYISVKEQLWKRNFFCYGVMRISPVIIQDILYEDGSYLYSNREGVMQTKLGDGNVKSFGGIEEFMDAYSVLHALPDMTELTDNKGGFVMLHNLTTHEPVMLQLPDYVPEMSVDNSAYETASPYRLGSDGGKVDLSDFWALTHYHVNVAALTQVGNWLDYLREQGVYDNTRIIIVADHGAELGCFDDMIVGASGGDLDAMYVNPLMMVKDFGVEEDFAADTSFMTNADTPVLAFSGIISDPVNPSTGKAVTNESKYSGEQHIMVTNSWNVEENNGNRFLPGDWFSFRGDNIFNSENWDYIGQY